MFRVAICDNDEQDLLVLKSKVEAYCDQNQIADSSIYTYRDSKELLNHIKEDQFDVYILDVIMPGLNGINLGSFIRDQRIMTPIIYTTSSREYAFQAFGVHAIDYLEKPVDDKKLAGSLDVVMKIYRNRNCKLLINSKNGIISVNLEDILYIENVSRSAVYTLADQTKITSVCNRTSFEKSVDPIPDKVNFIHPHKSYFVNMNYIRTMKSDKLIMENGDELPVSHERAPEAKHRYLKFISGKGTL